MENETYNDDGIECPSCGYVEDDPQVIYEIDENEQEIFECPSCGQAMDVMHNILHSWEAFVRTKEVIEEDIAREESNLETAKKQNPDCKGLYEQYERRIKDLKEELKLVK